MVWQKLLEWLNGQEPLPGYVRDYFVERSSELRLRMQAVFLEMQRRAVNMLASDIEFEEELRKEIRLNLPYMTARERTEALNTLNKTHEDRLKRLEAQMAGFDFFNTIEVSIQSLSDTKVTRDLANEVKALPSERRQHLMSMLNDIVKGMNKENEVPKLNTPDEQLNTTGSD